MPRHLLTKRDSGELKFKITRLPSDDSFMNSHIKSSSSALDSSMELSRNNSYNSMDGNFGLFLSPKTSTTLSPTLSLSPSSPPSKSSTPPRQFNNGTIVLGTTNHNSNVTATINHNSNVTAITPAKTKSLVTPTLTSSSSLSSSSSGVLGVKKNFLHRAFQRNFSPGKVYRADESALRFSSDSLSTDCGTHATGDAKRNEDENSIAIPSGFEMKSNRQTLTEIICRSPQRVPIPTIGNLCNLDDDEIINSSQTKSPLKRVSVLQFDPVQINNENKTAPERYGSNSSTSTRTPEHSNSENENTNPENITTVRRGKNSPKSKLRLCSSPKKVKSPTKHPALKEFPSVSSPRKLDYPSAIRSAPSVDLITRQEYFKDTAIPKLTVQGVDETRKHNVVPQRESIAHSSDRGTEQRIPHNNTVPHPAFASGRQLTPDYSHTTYDNNTQQLSPPASAVRCIPSQTAPPPLPHPIAPTITPSTSSVSASSQFEARASNNKTLTPSDIINLHPALSASPSPTSSPPPPPPRPPSPSSSSATTPTNASQTDTNNAITTTATTDATTEHAVATTTTTSTTTNVTKTTTENTTAATTTAGTATATQEKDKMANQAFFPYQVFYAQGLTGIPTPSPISHPQSHAHPHPHHSFLNPAIPYPLPAITHPLTHPTHSPLTPATHLLNRNDSGYDTTPNASYTSIYNINNNSSGNKQPSNSSYSLSSSSASSSTSANPSLSLISNGALPILASPPSGGGYLPSIATSSSSPAAPPSLLEQGIPTHSYHNLFTSTPHYGHNSAAYMNALLRHSSVGGLHAAGTSGHHPMGIPKRENPHAYPALTPPGQAVNHALMQHMAYMASMTGYPHYPLHYPHTAATNSLPQQAPLDLSSSEDSTSKPFRKNLFPGQQVPKVEVCTEQEFCQRKAEDKRNPFGINKILGVRSPIKMKIEIPTDVDVSARSDESVMPSPMFPPPLVKENGNSRKRRFSATSNDENRPEEEVVVDQEGPAPKKKKSRDRPPLWGQEIPDTIPEFQDCPEKEMFCQNGVYGVPDIPEDHEAQQTMIRSLLTLFDKSNLPPVPYRLRDNIFGLRFYPRMQTIFQAALYRDSRTLCTSYGGLAFDNFKAIEDNAIIDTMLEKRGNLYYCLTKKCIDPQGALCAFTATSLGKMRRHVKNHLPDKKWVCAFCRTQMTDQTDMARHGTTHTLLRPFPCEMCGKVFSQKVTLVNHAEKTHHVYLGKELSKDRYTCRQCGVHYKATQREECIEHLLKYHFDKEYQSLKKRKRFPFRMSTDSPSA